MNNKHKRGQVLILTIMLLATVITVVMTVSYKSTTETQISKLEEEAQKSLAAAEAGIEAALAQPIGTYVLSSLTGISGYTGNVSVATAYDRNTFVTRSLSANEGYTFYLADYDRQNNSFSSYWSLPLTIYVKSGGSCPAVELIRIKTDNSIVKNLIDPCNQLPDKVSGQGELTTGAGGTIEGVGFDYKATLSPAVAGDTKLMMMRALFASTRIGVEGPALSTLNSQGKTVVSEAQSATGVTKKIQLLQSNPQLPADFFVTRF